MVSLTTVIALIKKLSSSPSGDLSVDDILANLIEFKADGVTESQQTGNYKFDIVDNQLKAFRYFNSQWNEVATIGSIISDRFILDERYSSLTFDDPRYDGIQKNGMRITTTDDLIEVGDIRYDGVVMSGDRIGKLKLRADYNDLASSTLPINIQTINDTEESIQEYMYTITSPTNAVGAEANFIYSVDLDIRQDCQINVTIYNEGETINPVYQSVKPEELEAGQGIFLPSGTSNILTSRHLYLVPGQSYDVYLTFKESTLVGGTIDAAEFKPKIILNYIYVDEFKVYSEDNLTNDEVRNILGYFTDTKEPSGFVKNTDSSLSVIGSIFTITPNTIDYYYIQGKKYSIESAKSLTISDVEGMHYIYIDSNGELQETLTQSVDILLKNNAYVAALYWDSDNDEVVYLGDERHGISMDWATTKYLHDVLGTQYLDGLALSNFSVDGDGTSNTHCQFGYESGSIRDEDLVHIITSQSNPANIPIYYKDGSIPNIRRKTPNDFPFIGKTDITSTTRPKYNLDTAGVWSLAEVPIDNIWMVHYFATNDINNPIIGFLGLNVYSSTEDARNASKDEINQITGLPFTEFAPIGTVMFKTSSYTNDENAIIVSTDIGGDYVDFRGQSSKLIGTNANTSEHNNLTNRDSSNAHPSSSISYDNSASKLTSTEIKSAIDELDEKVELLASPTFVALDSGDPNVTYGGFSTTGLIRKRIISSGSDTFFQSSVALPVIAEASWTDWQNRESLTYA